jgi:hypothetical protein
MADGSVPSEGESHGTAIDMVLATAELAGSVLATDAQARGGGAHIGRFGGAHIVIHVGGFRAARIGGFGGSYVADIPRGAIGYAAGTGYGTGTGHGTGILRGRSSVLATSALAQTATSDDSTVAYSMCPRTHLVQSKIRCSEARGHRRVRVQASP